MKNEALGRRSDMNPGMWCLQCATSFLGVVWEPVPSLHRIWPLPQNWNFFPHSLPFSFIRNVQSMYVYAAPTLALATNWEITQSIQQKPYAVNSTQQFFHFHFFFLTSPLFVPHFTSHCTFSYPPPLSSMSLVCTLSVNPTMSWWERG